jgi:hypothetical protein
MPYTDEQKILTATRLKQLRKSKRTQKGKSFSYQTLMTEITKRFPDTHISDKSLMYYEIQNSSSEKFYIGKGMKIETLVLLADFYGVSCDYLLGRDPSDPETIRETSAKIGIDDESTEILLTLMNNKAVNDRLIFIINCLIHSVSINAVEGSQKTPSSNNPVASNSDCISPSFTNYLARYLYFVCGPQYFEDHPNAEEFGQLELSEDEVANLLLIELQNHLRQSRDNFRSARAEPEKTLKRLISRKKRNK